ncbi:tumor suppressor candidate 2-like [Homalodisca vitripennis]|uniref:Tumor suppressor candidate 2 n=1 Tax=Homalodisca liturata TaxID=320908 RepID=A0A1B6HXQ7_9HEMI|nr:tumor suppressor candidate 2-like [Homalodisca vitripennis]XP_046682990.1 tumor suppressor candidate 2-like [Homalodisca vitripennis]XP_046682991.1 tumor suppressor candidate 2-like [Homalodisca vitripennis]XP_046682992.1 tumor suppressor candidate 2-like [Homalodisca vitripennis]
MGSNASKIMKKFPFISSSSNPGGLIDCDSQHHGLESSKIIAGPMVLSRQGSMFFDEDGDLAHEFYEEVRPNKKGSKAKMKRIQTNLVPQGEVPYQCPRLHSDYPVILHQV